MKPEDFKWAKEEKNRLDNQTDTIILNDPEKNTYTNEQRVLIILLNHYQEFFIQVVQELKKNKITTVSKAIDNTVFWNMLIAILEEKNNRGLFLLIQARWGARTPKKLDSVIESDIEKAKQLAFPFALYADKATQRREKAEKALTYFKDKLDVLAEKDQSSFRKRVASIISRAFFIEN